MSSTQLLSVILFLAAQAVVIFAAYIDFRIKVSTKIKELEVRMSIMEHQDNRLFAKLDEITRAVHEVKIEVQNKKNRD